MRFKHLWILSHGIERLIISWQTVDLIRPRNFAIFVKAIHPLMALINHPQFSVAEVNEPSQVCLLAQATLEKIGGKSDGSPLSRKIRERVGKVALIAMQLLF